MKYDFPSLLILEAEICFVAGGASMPVGYEVVLRVLSGIPTKSIQNVLERVNHGLFINIDACD